MFGQRGESFSQFVRLRGLLSDAVDAGGAGAVDTPAIFAELSQAGGAGWRGREVNVRELGDGVAERIVHLAERAIAAVDVGDDAAGDGGGGGGGESFYAIADDEDDVRVQFGEGGGQAGHGL